MLLKLVRHGESAANVGDVDPAATGEFRVGLTPRGAEQARRAGQLLGADFITQALVYCSPFRRARETLAGLCAGAGVEGAKIRVYEDPRLREVDSGYTNREA